MYCIILHLLKSKIIAFIVLIPNIIDGFLKFRSVGVMERQNFKPTEVKENGELVAPSGGFNSLIRYILKRPMKEKTSCLYNLEYWEYFLVYLAIIAYVSKGAII